MSISFAPVGLHAVAAVIPAAAARGDDPGQTCDCCFAWLWPLLLLLRRRYLLLWWNGGR